MIQGGANIVTILAMPRKTDFPGGGGGEHTTVLPARANSCRRSIYLSCSVTGHSINKCLCPHLQPLPGRVAPTVHPSPSQKMQQCFDSQFPSDSKPPPGPRPLYYILQSFRNPLATNTPGEITTPPATTLGAGNSMFRATGVTSHDTGGRYSTPGRRK